MSGEGFRFLVTKEGERLDRLVADATGSGRRAVRGWLAAGLVRVDGRPGKAADTPAAGSEILVDSAQRPAAASAAALRVLVEREDFVVLDKPAGMHCERGRSGGSVAEQLDALYGDAATIGAREEEGGLVHRLDGDTSGVLLAARTPEAYRRLREAFARGATRKSYLALASGELAGSRLVDAALARRGVRMAAATRHDEAIEASTRFEAIDGGRGWTLLLATMRTGAMHQVRVHAAIAGLPLFGDTLYGGPSHAKMRRRGQHLHALRAEVAGAIDASAPVPGDFVELYAALRRGITSFSSAPI